MGRESCAVERMYGKSDFPADMRRIHKKTARLPYGSTAAGLFLCDCPIMVFQIQKATVTADLSVVS